MNRKSKKTRGRRAAMAAVVGVIAAAEVGMEETRKLSDAERRRSLQGAFGKRNGRNLRLTRERGKIARLISLKFNLQSLETK